MYVELPLIETSTPAQRLQALKDAKDLMAGQPETTSGGLFGSGTTTKPRDHFDANEAIRLAEYITTGHDYRDTHPEGKRRPIIHQAHVNVVGMPKDVAERLITDDFLEHLLHDHDGGAKEDEDPRADGDSND